MFVELAQNGRLQHSNSINLESRKSLILQRSLFKDF